MGGGVSHFLPHGLWGLNEVGCQCLCQWSVSQALVQRLIQDLILNPPAPLCPGEESLIDDL